MKTKNEKNMQTQLLIVLTNTWAKISLILSSCWGWLATMILAFLTYIAPIQTMLIILTVIVIIDMVLGVYINRKNILSSKLRNTVIKLMFYAIVIILAFSIENVLGLFILAPIIFSVCSMVELISVMANMSIIAPSVRVFTIIRKLLRNEIANKTGIRPDQVSDALEGKEIKDNEMKDMRFHRKSNLFEKMR